MAGTVGPAAKREIIRRLKETPALAGNKLLTVAYSFPGREVTRELIYGGRIVGPVQLSAMAMAGGLVARREDLVLSLHIWTLRPGEGTTELAEARVAELGLVVEELLADDPTLSDAVPGLKLAAITNVDLDSGNDDDGALAELTYQVALVSHIR